MKAINIKLATVSFAALLMASCSDSSDNGGLNNPTANTTIIGNAVTSITDASTLASRVHNYKVTNPTSKAKSRAAYTSTWDGVTVPENAATLEQNGYNEVMNVVNKNSILYIPAGKTISTNFNMQNKVVYVAGTLDFSNISGYWGIGEIRILKGGTFKAYNNDEALGKDIIINYGTIELPSSKENLYIDGANTVLDNHGNFDVSGKFFRITNNATVNVTGTLTAKSLQLTYSKLYSACSVNIEKTLCLGNASEFNVMYLHCNNFIQDSGAKLVVKDQSMVECDGIFMNLNQSQDTYYTLSDANGVCVIKAKQLAFNAPGPDSQGHILCNMFQTPGAKGTFIIDVDENQIYGIDPSSNDASNRYEYPENGPQRKLPKDNSIIQEGYKIEWNANANVILASDSESKKYVIKKTEDEESGCKTPGYNDDGKKDEDPKSDLITTIESDHTHEISATGIMPLNGHLYMSYHTNEKQTDQPQGITHGGCVEVFSPVKVEADGKKVYLEQYLYDEARDLDFNHILATKLKNNDRMVYLPGSSNKKGAMLAYMKINDGGLIATESKEIASKDGDGNVTYEQPLNFIQLHPATTEFAKKGYDENCVVYNYKTNHLIVATTEGYIVYDPETYMAVGQYARPGKVKHIAYGNGKYVALYLDNRDATSGDDAVTATIEIIDRDAEDFTQTKTFPVKVNIQPNDGKNVVAVNDNKIYVCQGAHGLYCYDMNGNELWHYQMPNPINEKGQYKALANGCFVDGNYVYIAYGSYGLVVLDKNTHEPVMHRQATKSANYVTVHDGYIYVAYGRSRLQVFELSK